MLLRSRDGQLRCFANYCRHRGSILLEGRGNTGGRIICPYHAWSYFDDGRLYGCPDMKDAEGFDRVENGLVALRLESFAGFLFANFADGGPSLPSILATCRRFASRRLDRMRWAWDIILEPLRLEALLEKRHGDLPHRHCP